MKKSILLAIILFCSTLIYAQNDLIVQNSDKTLYLNHTVVAKENFYSIGRLFNTTAKEIASFNQVDMNHGLQVGQVLRIPLNGGNFTQLRTNGRPVYYVVGNGEGLYRVSMKNGSVLMASVRKWNHLQNDQITVGQKLIIGYLISPEAANINEPVAETVAVTTEEAPKDAPKEVPKEVQKEIPKKDIPVQKTDVSNDKVEKAQVQEPEKKPEVVTPPPTRQVAVNDGNGGYFKTQFDQQTKVQPIKSEQTASAGIFKTASGWQDAKYYALMDGIEPGTIIRIVNPTNNKAVYAKVLGEMSGIRQNQGYDVRVSNAAASALEVSDTDKFIVRVVH